jgi:hypothetical protein
MNELVEPVLNILSRRFLEKDYHIRLMRLMH